MWVAGGDDYSSYGASFVEETAMYNRIVLGWALPSRVWDPLPHFLQTWLRNYIGGMLLYFVSGLLWCFVIYYWKRNLYVPKDCIPSRRAMLLQIRVAMKAMPWYSLFITFSEHMVESGWTRCFPQISDISLQAYLGYLLIYLLIVEFGIYWMHRELHDIKPLYKYLHATHHIYNKENTLSPFAGLAFHPLDGILQAVPHSIALFLVPTHFRTHIALFFLEGVWTANIHDCIHGKLWPVMGAGYHTIHHITYRHNYGHFTVLMDWLFGTLRTPSIEDDEPKKGN
ncbi:hypothetical protein Cgig2_029873 [Carnegiea gigantea]|uniref:Fatty acid hydroxylase domain-containing protein n=1 Tax=Carnegiea gigantea TaxID=171969 RepID=A0A9Q1K4R5_9CARY|nr:hypothetical protein Cgig2_029873 [Carnegiea gigantea]